MFSSVQQVAQVLDDLAALADNQTIVKIEVPDSIEAEFSPTRFAC
jgi:hypothetical protein